MKKHLFVISMLAGWSTVAVAQNAPTPPPVDLLVDSNGVDLVNATLNVGLPSLWIGGSKDQPILQQYNFVSGLGTRDVNAVTITAGQVNIGGSGFQFPMALPPITASYNSPRGTGETLTSTPSTFTFTDREGTVTNFVYRGANYAYYPAQDATAPEAIASSRILSSGEIINYYYKTFSQAQPGWTLYVKRLQSVTSSFGYMLKYEYSSDTTSGNYSQITRVTAINNSIDYCDPTADHCSGLTKVWPNLQYSGLTSGPSGQFFETITSPDNEVTRLTWNVSGNGELTSVRFPGATSDNITTTVDPLFGFLNSATNNGVTYNYTFGATVPGACINYGTPTYDSICPVTIYDGSGSTQVVQIKGWGATGANKIWSRTDELGRATAYSYDSLVRPTRVTSPEGGYTNYTYDSRGNVLEQRVVAKPGSGLPDMITTAQYSTGCSNSKTCNKPISVTDPNGNTTSFTYDSAHGGVLTVTRPAVGGISPVTRYSYVQRYAWIKNAAGAYVAAASPIWLLDQERTCSSTATVGNACAGGAADEMIKAYDYGPNSGPNNLTLRGVVVTSNGVSLRTCYGYDYLGRRISETAPRANLTACP